MTNSARNPETELATIISEQTFQETLLQDIIVDYKLGVFEGNAFRNGYRVHCCALTETVRDKQYLLVFITRGRKRAGNIERYRSAWQSGKGMLVTDQQTVLGGDFRA